MKLITKNGQAIAYFNEKYADALRISLDLLRKKEIAELENAMGLAIDPNVKISFNPGEIAVAGQATGVLLIALAVGRVEEMEEESS